MAVLLCLSVIFATLSGLERLSVGSVSWIQFRGLPGRGGLTEVCVVFVASTESFLV